MKPQAQRACSYLRVWIHNAKFALRGSIRVCGLFLPLSPSKNWAIFLNPDINSTPRVTPIFLLILFSFCSLHTSSSSTLVFHSLWLCLLILWALDLSHTTQCKCCFHHGFFMLQLDFFYFELKLLVCFHVNRTFYNLVCVISIHLYSHQTQSLWG